MSSIINKVKDAVSSDKHQTTTHSTAHGTAEGTHGPHTSRVANTADPRVDSDRDHRAAPGSTIGTGSGYTTNDNYTYGTGSSTTGYNDPEGTHGPHSSRLANAVDPRVDSDRDHRAAPTTHGATGASTGMTGGMTGGRTAGTTTTHGATGMAGGRTAGSTTTGYDDPEGVHGPHSSRLANAVDPRVDSDRDHRAAPRTTGATAGTTGAGFTGGRTAGTTTTGYDDPEGTHGPHSSRLANAMDPRVDSDRDHRAAGATTGTTTGTHGGVTGGRTTGTTTGAGFTSGRTAGTTTTGYDDPEGVHGPHSSRLANAADPRVDSDRDHRAAGTTTGTHGGVTGTTHGTHGTHGTHSTTTGTHGGVTGATHGTHGGATGYTASNGPGPAANTAGPHKSDMMNKLDPRVDSDLDGSKTVGGNKTYSSRDIDPTDASQAPPSVLRKHVGEPSIEHGDHLHDRDRRNSTATAQEIHRGI